MNTPYATPAVDLRTLAVLFYQWNEGVQRAMDEYAIHPLANCPHGGSCTRRYRRNGRW